MTPDPTDERIDWVVPPFAGHAYPALMVAAGLRRHGYTGQRILSTPSLGPVAADLGLPFAPLMEEREEEILSIANTKARGPRAMMRQFRATLNVLEALGSELTQTWGAAAPDLVIADSVLPSAGLAAQRLGVDWWTSMASLAPTETRSGTPAYLGGWKGAPDRPNRGMLALRDAMGRFSTRLFKRTMSVLARDELRRMGLPSIYRADGTEAFYSDDCVLGFGSLSFEFHRDWPPAMRFVGPVFGSPAKGNDPPPLEPGRVHVLVTLGTHLQWAKSKALDTIRAVARAHPDWTFHFSRGESGGNGTDVHGNLQVHPYIPYDNLSGYRYAVVHGGAGVVYACLAQGIPMVLWPHDYDQFDNAARVVVAGAGVRSKGTARGILRALDQVSLDPAYKVAAERLSRALREDDAVPAVAALLRDRRRPFPSGAAN